MRAAAGFDVAADCLDVFTEVVTVVGIALRRAGRRAWRVMAGPSIPPGHGVRPGQRPRSRNTEMLPMCSRTVSSGSSAPTGNASRAHGTVMAAR